jgi:nucleoid-associated protein YgaU
MANGKNIDDELSHDYSFDIEPIRDDEFEQPKTTKNKSTSTADDAAVAAYDTKGKDRIALVIALVFVAALAFFGFRYFGNADTSLFSGDGNGNGDLTQEDIMAAQTERGNDGIAPGYDGADGTTNGAVNVTVTKSVFVWVPNDYEQGDISPGTYEVQEGDTLWEISEAVYGNGADWVKILDANADSVDYLSSGQQALIYAGQTLAIPS